MVRPTLLITEPEHPEGLSTRKLVIETGKFNVLTAYSTDEAVELVAKFPAIDAIVVHSSAPGDVKCDEVLERCKQHNPNVYSIFLSATDGARCPGADQVISSHEPQVLLDDVRKRFGDPRKMEPKQK